MQRHSSSSSPSRNLRYAGVPNRTVSPVHPAVELLPHAEHQHGDVGPVGRDLTRPARVELVAGGAERLDLAVDDDRHGNQAAAELGAPADLEVRAPIAGGPCSTAPRQPSHR